MAVKKGKSTWKNLHRGRLQDHCTIWFCQFWLFPSLQIRENCTINSKMTSWKIMSLKPTFWRGLHCQSNDLQLEDFRKTTDFSLPPADHVQETEDKDNENCIILAVISNNSMRGRDRSWKQFNKNTTKEGFSFWMLQVEMEKRFWLNLLIAFVRKDNEVTFASAAKQDVTSSPLMNESTAHSTFLYPFECSVCKIGPESKIVDNFIAVKLIAWN